MDLGASHLFMVRNHARHSPQRIRVGLSTDARKSAQILVIAMDLGDKLGHAEAQILSSLAPRADDPSAAMAEGVVSEDHQMSCSTWWMSWISQPS